MIELVSILNFYIIFFQSFPSRNAYQNKLKLKLKILMIFLNYEIDVTSLDPHGLLQQNCILL